MFKYLRYDITYVLSKLGSALFAVFVVCLISKAATSTDL